MFTLWYVGYGEGGGHSCFSNSGLSLLMGSSASSNKLPEIGAIPSSYQTLASWERKTMLHDIFLNI